MRGVIKDSPESRNLGRVPVHKHCWVLLRQVDSGGSRAGGRARVTAGREAARAARAQALKCDEAQSNRLETDSSAAVRAIASPIRVAIESTRMLPATRTASVGWMESVITSSLRREAVTRATAPPDSTPWVM